MLRIAPVDELAATAKTLALNLGILGNGGVHGGLPSLATRVGRALPARLGATVWFYLAASAALLAGMSLGLWLAGGVAGDGDAWRALRLAHVHLNVFGWVGLAVVRTQVHLVAHGAADLDGGGRRAGGPLIPAAAGARPGGGRRTGRRRSCSEPGWPGSPSRAPQTLTGALTYLLPVVFGRSTFATASSAASGPGLAAARGRDQSWRRAAGRLASRRMGVTMGWWLAGLGVGGFVPLAAAALLASYLRTEEAK